MVALAFVVCIAVLGLAAMWAEGEFDRPIKRCTPGHADGCGHPLTPIAAPVETDAEYERRVLSEVRAWTPQEYEAYGHAETDRLIERIRAELFDDSWDDLAEESRQRREAARVKAPPLEATELRTWGHIEPVRTPGWHLMPSSDGTKVWVQD